MIKKTNKTKLFQLYEEKKMGGKEKISFGNGEVNISFRNKQYGNAII